MATALEVLHSPIPNLDTPWVDVESGTCYGGDAIEDFLKSQLRGKIGALDYDTSVDSYVTVRGFATQEDRTSWLLDKSDESLVIEKRTFEVASRSGDGTAYVVSLVGQNTNTPKFTNVKTLQIPLKFTCKKATTVSGTTTSEDMAGISGTIVVTGRKSGTSGSYVQLTPADGQPRYMDAVAESSNTYKNFDLGPYLQDGEWNYRINIIEPESGTSSTTVTVNVTLSESMGLIYNGELGTVFGGDTVSLPFYVLGSVDRHLHIEVLSADGRTVIATPEAQAFSSTQGGNEVPVNFNINRSQCQFHHGTYMIHAWLTFAEDTNGARIAEQTFGIMYAEEGNNNVLVAVANALANAANYDTLTLLDYAVYNPAGDDYTLTLSVIDGTDGDIVYYTEDATCENGQTYSMHTVLSCDHALGDFNVLVKIEHGARSFYTGTLRLTNDIDFSPVGTANLLLEPNTKTFRGTDKTGHSFVLNPATLKLQGQPAGNRTKILNPSVEGFVREGEVDMFRMLKGSLLDLPFEPIINTTGLNVGSVDHSITMEFDMKVRNIQDESAPLISCYTESNNSFVGLKVTPNRILVLGSGSGPISTEDMADYYLEEDRRMHVVVNIVNNLRNEGLNYMRIFADGVLQREYTYPSSVTSPFCGASGSNGHLLIGSTGCDVDLYGIRIMMDQALSSTNIQQDYKASMPNILDKRAFKEANDDIMSGSVIDYDKAKEKYNTILYRIPNTTTFPTFNNDTAGDDGINGVVMVVKIIGDEKHSGTFNSMNIKRQGSTAKKYYWPNISAKFTKADQAKGTIKGVFTSDGINPETGVPYYNGTSYYQLDDNQPKAKKLVGKANYASSMQSHKAGATAAFHDLHRICALPSGGFTYDRQNPRTPSRRAVFEKPFLCFFTDRDYSTPTFCGFQTWGAAKGDEPTFGYDSDSESAGYTPGYIMIEGADNNVPGANFETPWIPSEMLYDKDEESFCYNGAPNFDFDLGAKVGDKTDALYDHPTGGAVDTLNDYVIPAFNMVYLLNPNLEAFSGNLSALNQAYARDKARQTDPENEEPLELKSNVHYWCSDTSSSEYLRVYRMDYVNDVWVNAGLATTNTIDDRGYKAINTAILNLKTQLGIADADLTGMTTAEKTAFFIERRVAAFRTQFPTYFDKSDALFHQCIVKLFAGTDNRAKNTYYWVEGNIDHLIRFAGDDLDTIFKTDNKGQQSKKYWILEDDKDEYDAYFWNGYNNGLFRLIELAFEDDMRLMMNKIFSAMTTISGSVEQFFQDYFYHVQEYYPAVAYNETARLLYEKAQLFYDGICPDEPGKSYGYKEMPITQSLGNQIHAEREYMTKRLALLESYANYGVFSLNGTDSITFTSTGSSTYIFHWTAYQDIFPVAAFGQALNFGVDEFGVAHTKPWRLKAGHTCTFQTQMSGETTVAIHGMSFCSNIGNIGANAMKGNLRITGKRLRNLIMPKMSNQFKPDTIAFASNLNLENVDMRNIQFSNTSLDFTQHMSLSQLDMSGCTGVSSVNVPKTSALQLLKLPSGLTRLELMGMPSLETFSIDNVANLHDALVDQDTAPGVDTITLAAQLKDNANNLATVSMLNVDWVGLSTNLLMWFAGKEPYSYGLTSERYSLTGNASIDQASQRLTFAYKCQLIEKYGNIDAANNVLSLTYDKYTINSIVLNGESYIRAIGNSQYSVNVSPSTANNVAIVQDASGRVHEDVQYLFIDQNGNEATPTQYCSWEDAVKGLLDVHAITTESSGVRYTLRVKVNTIVNGAIRTLTSDLQVAFYLRHPKIADFAYADGTFDDQYQKDKTVVGAVIKRNPMYQGDDDAQPIVFRGYNHPTEAIKQSKRLVGYELLIDSSQNAVVKSSDGVINTSNLAWGLYNEGSERNPIYSTYGFRTAFATEVAQAANMSSIFETAMANVGSTTDWPNGTYILPSNYLDPDEDDGFKNLGGSVNAANDWDGFVKTKIIVEHMENLFNNYLMGDSNNDVATQYTDSNNVTHSITNLPENLTELGDMMEILQNGNGNLSIFKQWAYPAAYACYLYEPTLKDGETLDSQYAKHKWHLPASGLLFREFAFFARSRTGGWDNTSQSVGQGTVPNKSVIDDAILAAYNSPEQNYINRNVKLSSIQNNTYTSAELNSIAQYFNGLTESDIPLYSLVLWRALLVAASSPFANHTVGYHWSSSEYNSYYSWGVYFYGGNSSSGNKFNELTVRPAVAYEFLL